MSNPQENSPALGRGTSEASGVPPRQAATARLDGGARPGTDHGAIRLTILTLFFLSGACGLVYEGVWMGMLTLVFGATAFATSTILASFFSGPALGSFTLGG